MIDTNHQTRFTFLQSPHICTCIYIYACLFVFVCVCVCVCVLSCGAGAQGIQGPPGPAFSASERDAIRKAIGVRRLSIPHPHPSPPPTLRWCPAVWVAVPRSERLVVFWVLMSLTIRCRRCRCECKGELAAAQRRLMALQGHKALLLSREAMRDTRVCPPPPSLCCSVGPCGMDAQRS